MTAEATANSLASTTKTGAMGLLHVVAKWFAPLLGLIIGFALYAVVGGAWTIANFMNDVLADAKMASGAWVAAVGGIIYFVIFWAFGGVLWHVGGSGHVLVQAVTRFFAGMFFGIGLGGLVGGLTNNLGSPGAIDKAFTTVATEVEAGIE